MSIIKQDRYFFAPLWLLTVAMLFSCRGDGGGGGGPPAAPQNFTATPSNGQVTLNWDVELGVAYNLFPSISPGIDVGDENASRISNVNSPYVHEGLRNGDTYYYRMTANDSLDVSEPTAEVSATPLPPPAAPQNFTATPSNGQVTLNWTSQPGITYNLFHSRNAGFSLESGTKIPGVTSPHPHTGLMNGTTYYYRLTAVNPFGTSAPYGRYRQLHEHK